jgi:hypothetical protein
MSDDLAYICPRHKEAFTRLANVLYPWPSNDGSARHSAGDNDLASLSIEAASLIGMYQRMNNRIKDDQAGLQALSSRLADTMCSNTSAQENFGQVAVIVQEAISHIGRIENQYRDAKAEASELRLKIGNLNRVLEGRLMDQEDGASASDAYWNIAEVLQVPEGGSVTESAEILKEFHDRMAGMALKYKITDECDPSIPVDKLIEAFSRRLKKS